MSIKYTLDGKDVEIKEPEISIEGMMSIIDCLFNKGDTKIVKDFINNH